MSIRSMFVTLQAFVLFHICVGCVKYDVREHLSAVEPPVLLVGDFTSKMTMREVRTKLEGSTQAGESRAFIVERAPSSGWLLDSALELTSYRIDGAAGRVRFDFYQDFLVSVNFFPNEPRVFKSQTLKTAESFVGELSGTSPSVRIIVQPLHITYYDVRLQEVIERAIRQRA